MPDLIAQGVQLEQRWRRRVNDGQTIVVGRSAGRWSVPWDDRISRSHVRVQCRRGGLLVERLTDTLNPVFFRGSTQDQFQLQCGEHFVIGSTTFSLVDQELGANLDAPPPITEETLSHEQLQQLQFHDADRRLDVLSRLSELLATAATDDEQAARLVQVLLSGIPQATFAAWVEVPRAHEAIRIVRWDQRSDDRQGIAPSERLIRQAILSQANMIHIWPASAMNQPTSFTQHDGSDWAFCVPLPPDIAGNHAVYVAGRLLTADAAPTYDTLREDVKFVALAAQSLVRMRGLRRFEREAASLRQFISPVVLDALGDSDPEQVLAPREAQVSVLFCDLRGFSRRTELEANDLFGLLHRVSEALGVMTRQILEHGGVVGDFHGDSAMGFWGWPLDQKDAAARACQAALCIRREFAQAAADSRHRLADFRMGIGIATGRAVAGKIGTIDQVKVTVFGPVVNLASRLEDLTKTLRASILIDEVTANYARQHLPADIARIRRVARVRPYNLAAGVEVSELLPPATEFPQMPDEGIAAYEEALDALLSREWDRAFSLLHRVPAEDRVKDFLTVFIAQHNRTPPTDWDGVIPLGKSSQLESFRSTS